MELNIIKAVQMLSSPLFDNIFKIITLFGEELILVPIIAYFYWCVDKKKGIYVIESVAASLTVGNILKCIFKMPRPIGVEGVRSIYTETATGYSMPSLHTANISSFLTSVNILNGGVKSSVLSFIFVMLVGLSRIYLGVHYPKDVLVGMILGIVISLAVCFLFEKLRNELLVAFIIVAVMSLGFLTEVSADFYKSYGLCLGTFFGILLEKALVEFKMPRNSRKKNLRLIFGLLTSGLLYMILKAYMPETDIYCAIRYFILSFYSIGIYPMIFKKFKI